MSEKLGAYLKQLRGDKSLREVGRSTGISNTYLMNLEKGADPRSKNTINPSPETLRSLSNYFGVNYIDLMILAGYISKDDIVNAAVKILRGG